MNKVDFLRQDRAGASALSIYLRRIYFACTGMLFLFAAPSVCFAEGEEKIVVQEWHKQGLVAALTDPNSATVFAALTSQNNWPLIPAILKALGGAERQKVVPVLENLLVDSDSDVVAAAARALGHLGATRSIPALEKFNSRVQFS